AVWDVNGDVQVVKHIVTEYERPLVYTDRAMTESSAEAEEDDDAGEDELPLAFTERKALPAGRTNGFRGSAGALVPARSISGAGHGANSGESAGSVSGADSANGDDRIGDNRNGDDGRGGGHGRHSGPPAPDDPDLTAIAAAVFGPRASNPSQTGR